jgi:transcriptional regulator with XRE-family HTH domain
MDTQAGSATDQPSAVLDAETPGPASAEAAALEAPPKRRRGRPRGSTHTGPDIGEPLLALTLLRMRNGLTQSDLAERAGVHLSTLRRLENYPGTCQTTWQTLKKLADVLDVHPHELLAREAPKILSGDPITPAAARAAHPGTLPARDVLDPFDVARTLHMSTKTLRTVLRLRPEDLPRPLPQLDRSLRWSRVMVERWLNGDASAAGGRRRK